MSFYNLFFPLKVMFLRSIPVDMFSNFSFIPFLFLLYEYITVYLFFLMDISFFPQYFIIANHAVMNIFVPVFTWT